MLPHMSIPITETPAEEIEHEIQTGVFQQFGGFRVSRLSRHGSGFKGYVVLGEGRLKPVTLKLEASMYF